jgi:DNA-binding transcriptional MerR regulator
MVYTVKQLSDLAGVSVRTLHYYDEIGLLAPTNVGENGYRHYGGEALFRLQQILFYREMDLSLEAIKAILDQPDFDPVEALQAHRAALEARIRRLRGLIHTVDSTIKHLSGEADMSKKQIFGGFSKEEEERYAQEAREAYGAEEVDASYQRWNSYSEAQQGQIMAEGGAIYTDFVEQMAHGPDSPEVQAIVGRWHRHMRYFYEPSVARLRGLGQLYVDSPDFADKFRALHPDLPEFIQQAINHYCDALDAEAS